jgi:hypothetical protein
MFLLRVATREPQIILGIIPGEQLVNMATDEFRCQR